MSDNEPDFLPPAEDLEAAYTVNLVNHSDHDRSMLTIRAMDAEQLVERIGEATAHEVVDRIIELEKAFQAAERATRKLPPKDDGADTGEEKKTSTRRSTGNRSAGNGSANAAKSAPKGDGDVVEHPEGLTCEHVDEDGDADCGETVIKKIIKTKAGKTYKLWVCPNQRNKDDGHFSEFIN